MDVRTIGIAPVENGWIVTVTNPVQHGPTILERAMLDMSNTMKDKFGKASDDEFPIGGVGIVAPQMHKPVENYVFTDYAKLIAFIGEVLQVKA